MLPRPVPEEPLPMRARMPDAHPAIVARESRRAVARAAQLGTVRQRLRVPKYGGTKWAKVTKMPQSSLPSAFRP